MLDVDDSRWLASRDGMPTGGCCAFRRVIETRHSKPLRDTYDKNDDGL
ncbi:hypothetical protein [Paenibacillus sp. MY03]|nr:hypothetical protein [Paenibacillus sp. MY03]